MPSDARQAPRTRPITVAIAAMGGQGGGVLSDWIVDVAEHCGWYAQSTSVPGVAQRTGATVYYLEIFPRAQARAAGREPVMALMPVPGDVDLVIAGELLEAGRAAMRGFVTPDRTVLVASTHRDYSLAEKMAMGDGRLDDEELRAAAAGSARTCISFDMQQLADEQGSVISAVLFGAAAASAVLPFTRAEFEDAIRRSGVAVESNLRAFGAGFDRASTPPAAVVPAAAVAPPRPRSADPAVNALLDRAFDAFPAAVHDLLVPALRRLVDYQDVRHAREYLDRLAPVLALDEAHGGPQRGYRLTRETARHLALWMSYEDAIRVADLKTRSGRFARVREEATATPDQLVYVTEFMHPRVEEICDILPAPVGAWILSTAPARDFLGLFCRSGRKVRTATLGGFLLLYALASLRRIRRGTLRHRAEEARIGGWLSAIASRAPVDYDLAVEIAGCQRLVKGYGDTHDRGVRNFGALMSALDRLAGRTDAARILAELRAAALADEHGETLAAALSKVG